MNNNELNDVEKWQKVVEAYAFCADKYVDNSDAISAKECLTKINNAKWQIDSKSPFNPGYLDDFLLKPYGGKKALLDEINNNKASNVTMNLVDIDRRHDDLKKTYDDLKKTHDDFKKTYDDVQKTYDDIDDMQKTYDDIAARVADVSSIQNGLFGFEKEFETLDRDYEKLKGESGSSFPTPGIGDISGRTEPISGSYGGVIKTTPYTPIGKKDSFDNANANPYQFDFDELSEDDKLENLINANLPVFLHGKSGSGKSERIKAIDKNCEVIYLGSARPEVLLGKSIVVNDALKDVPPTWYVNLCEKCKKEPDKIHILFFDEITNATPALQGYAFNIILDREVNGKWKLPENARVVAAGNEAKESTAANKIPEPLFRRFNHVYVEEKLEKWLLWASKHNIHPAIYAYVACKGDGKDQILRTECDGKNPCIDPRKWKMASDLLYATNNPYSLTPALGEKVTNDFANFCKRPVITLEQVLNGDYDKNMPRIPIDEGYATLIGLAACSEKDIEVVRDFVKKYVIPDQYQNFVMLWTHGDTARLDKIHELDIMDSENKKGGK